MSMCVCVSEERDRSERHTARSKTAPRYPYKIKKFIQPGWPAHLVNKTSATASVPSWSTARQCWCVAGNLNIVFAQVTNTHICDLMGVFVCVPGCL